ncbi:hypothetical protein PsAD2_04181 [Pseudovibrio axinellae]|uniref:Uncharacterized protein n=2 Tax=Pseudovibrio axinellae TaxID=989403 RepID=A0A165TXD5_9HYPH|nr:hypothetical protein PsAD2_04181 [Pseudovibrio axinellae]SER84058.1 hypothetical protein SAMN05421798_1337 [Pseudovibrio axinellae]
MGLIVAADSYLPHALKVHEAFQNKNWSISLILCSQNGQITLSKRQLKRFQVAHIEIEDQHLSLDDLKSNTGFLCKYDAVYLGLPAHHARNELRILKGTKTDKPPITISAFPGVLYYIQTYGQWCRAGSDILLFNDRRTFADYAKACKYLFGTTSENAVLFGYPSFANLPANNNGKNLVYVDQNILPKRKTDRKNLFTKIISIGEKNDFEKVVFLARNRPEEKSNHNNATCSHVETIVSEICNEGSSQIGVEVNYGSPQDVLLDCKLCLGINSTVLLYSMFLGIPTAPLKTPGAFGRFGGVRLFQKTRMAMSINELLNGRTVKMPTKEWSDANLLPSTDANKNLLLETVEARIATPLPARCLPNKLGTLMIARFICRAFDILLHYKV